jgi:uncharacterized protein
LLHQAKIDTLWQNIQEAKFMDFAGERLIEAPRENIWAALNDPEILKNCLPGCEALEKLSDTSWKTSASVTLGPIAARFTGTLLLSDLDPPNGYTISGEGQSDEAGSAKGNAKVALSDVAGRTRLSYQIAAKMEGKIGQFGDDLTDSAAQQYAEAFFAKFAAIVVAPALGGATPDPVYHLAHEDHDHDPSNPRYFGLPLGVIIAGVVAIIAICITLAKFFIFT